MTGLTCSVIFSGFIGQDCESPVKVWNNSFCLLAAVALLACLGASGSGGLVACWWDSVLSCLLLASPVFDVKHWL